MRASAIRCASDRGVIAPMTAVVMAVLIGMVGLVTDAGVWFADRRQLQDVTDTAALAAARYANDAVAARAAASTIFTQNGLDPTKVLTQMQTGNYCPDVSKTVALRFQNTSCVGGSTVPDAVRLTTTSDTQLYLSQFFITGKRQISTTATAARINQAGLEAGSGLASLNGGVANAMLSALTGGSVALSAVQYNGLLNTKVDTLTFLDALAAKVGITAGTYSSVLASNIGIGDLIDTQIAVLTAQTQTADVAAAVAGMRLLRGQVAGNQTVSIGKLFDLGLWSNAPVGDSTSASALHAGLNLLQLTSFALQIANGKNFATIPSSTIGIAGVASLRVEATAIEPPTRSYYAFGPAGTTVHTAQVRLKLRLEVLTLVSQLGTGLNVPIYIEVAAGDARIDSINCGGSPATDATVAVTAHAGISNVYLGTVPDDAMTNFSAPVSAAAVQPVVITNPGLAGLLTIGTTSAKAAITIGSSNGAGTALTFVQPVGTPVQTEPPTQRGVIGRPAFPGQTASPAIRARAISSNVSANLLGGLAETMQVRTCTTVVLGVCVLPITLTGAAVGMLYTTLDPILTGLDNVINGLLRTLGIQLGYVDVSVTGVRCGLPVLVS